MADKEFRSGCPIASTLDLVGDRWSLVILRDLANGKTRFAQFLDSPEKIATNTLTARLAQLEADGLIVSKLYQKRPKRFEYRLTAMGAALMPVLQAISTFGSATLPRRWVAPEKFMKLKPSDLA